VDYVLDCCGSCGCDLQAVPEEFISKGQVIDIPVIQPLYIEYWMCQKQCNCSHSTSGSYP